MYPAPKKEQYPTLLDHAPPVLHLYPPETVFAEKLEAMIHLGELNSRMKDFYDIWRLMQQAFEGEALYEAVSQTLNNRSTEAIPFIALEQELNQSSHKQAEWTAFLTKSQIVGPEKFDELLKQIAIIASPVLDALIHHTDFDMDWKPNGPWEKR